MRLTLLLAATAAVTVLGLASASAQGYGPPRDNSSRDNPYNSDQRDNFGPRDPTNYYSQADQNGFYDRRGTYHKVQARNFRQDGGTYYQQGAYEQNCRGGNQAAGTIFGALAGGLIGSAASHGNGGAVVGGAVLGGLLGNVVTKDISCDDQPYAFQTYSTGLNGDVGRRYDWQHNQSRGYFMPTREYRRSGTVCRDFTETTYRGREELTRTGTACRSTDGNWRFD